jgi:hypothetical protein
MALDLVGRRGAAVGATDTRFDGDVCTSSPRAVARVDAMLPWARNRMPSVVASGTILNCSPIMVVLGGFTSEPLFHRALPGK